MRRTPLLMILIFATIGAFAQQTEPIYSFARVYKPLSWYKEQSTAWKKEITRNKKNAYAWYNYYRVNRNITRTDTTDTRSWEERQKAERQIVEEMGKAIPNSFEYNLCKWMIEGNNFEYLSYLKKAEELGAGRTEHLSDMVGWGEVEGDPEKRDRYARLWFESGEYSPGMLNYNYNVMAGLKENAILITAGDNDTYPVWILQAAKGFRRDIVVLNKSLLMIDSYRKLIFKKLGVNNIEYKVDARQGQSAEDASKEANDRLLKALVANTQNRPVYIAITVCNDDFEKSQDKLYLTGLAYEYSASNIDNIAVMKRNFEHRYALDYIQTYLYHDASAEIVARLNMNYVVCMMKLYEHYNLAGEKEKAEGMKTKILSIVKNRPEENETMQYLNKQG